MAKLTFLKRLIKEDFKQESWDLIGKIAFILNPALEAITNTLNKSLTFTDNFNSQIKDLEFKVDAAGKPTISVSFISTLKGNCGGLWCVRADNLTNPANYPTTAPFLLFSQSGSQIIIDKALGLVPYEQYRLRVITIVN